MPRKSLSISKEGKEEEMGRREEGEVSEGASGLPSFGAPFR